MNEGTLSISWPSRGELVAAGQVSKGAAGGEFAL